MAVPMFSGVGIVDMQNSLGGDTFSRNAYGTYVKTRIGAPAGSAFLTDWNNIYSGIYFDWINIMNDTQRLAWYKFAIRKRNNMAQIRWRNGFEAFMSVNLTLALIPTSPIYTPPPNFNPPSIPNMPFFNALTSGTIDVAVTTGFNADCLIYLSKALPVTRMSYNQIFAFMGTMPYLGTLQGCWGNWTARYGALAPGMKVYGKYIAVNSSNGCRSTPRYFVGIST